MSRPDNTEDVRIGLANESNLLFLVGDITLQSCDAIVNAANSSLMGGGGVDGAIHDAGGRAILEECKTIVHRSGPLPPGQAVITTAGNLPSRHVIHTVGPVWYGGEKNEASTLENCYRNVLRLAEEHRLKTIAFPSISTGAFRYPVNHAAAIAVRSVSEELQNLKHVSEVRFVLFDRQTFRSYVNEARKLLEPNS